MATVPTNVIRTGCGAVIELDKLPPKNSDQVGGERLRAIYVEVAHANCPVPVDCAAHTLWQIEQNEEARR